MRSLLKLYPFLRPQLKLILIAGFFAIPLAGVRSSPPILLKYLQDEVLVKKDERMLLLLPLAIVGIFLINLVVRYFSTFCSRLATERILQSIRVKLFDHYLSLSASFFSDSSTGRLISRVTNDVFYVSQGTINLINLIRDLVTFLCLFFYAIHLNWKLLSLCLFVAPILSWLGSRAGRLMKSYALHMQDANGALVGILQESFSGFRVVKAYALEALAVKRFTDANNTYVRNALRAARVEEAVGPTVELTSAIAIALIIYVGGHDVLAGKLSPGDLMAFFACFGLMINPVRNLNDINLKLNLAAASAERIFETLALKTDILESANPMDKVLQYPLSVKFSDVSFRYSKSGCDAVHSETDSAYLLKNISFEVPAGKVVAIVGASGQGKSTLLNLVPRLYDCNEGAVLVGGVDVRELSFASLRSQIAMVTQDVFLFNDTVLENVRVARPNATEGEIRAALAAAQALGFVERLPLKELTVVGDRGQKLSGGERQRLSIARAILKQAPILLLDEATSSLDSESEKAVQAGLEQLMNGKTTIVVAHRLSTIREADEILVVSNGSIVERGTHQVLLGLGGEYSRFYGLLND